jgi:hypothetical protein
MSVRNQVFRIRPCVDQDHFFRSLQGFRFLLQLS